MLLGWIFRLQLFGETKGLFMKPTKNLIFLLGGQQQPRLIARLFAGDPRTDGPEAHFESMASASGAHVATSWQAPGSRRDRWTVGRASYFVHLRFRLFFVAFPCWF